MRSASATLCFACSTVTLTPAVPSSAVPFRLVRCRRFCCASSPSCFGSFWLLSLSSSHSPRYVVQCGSVCVFLCVSRSPSVGSFVFVSTASLRPFPCTACAWSWNRVHSFPTAIFVASLVMSPWAAWRHSSALIPIVSLLPGMSLHGTASPLCT